MDKMGFGLRVLAAFLVGVAIGAALGNVAMGAGLGIALAVIVSTAFDRPGARGEDPPPQ